MTCFYCSQISSDVYHCLCLQASCRRNFSLDVVLLDTLGHSATKDVEVYISGFCIVYESSPSLIGSFTISYIFNLNLACLDSSQVIASLLYADNGALVENTTDGEAPLLASYDGIEYASCERPSKLLQGRASFKLKISQVLMSCVKCCFRHLFREYKWNSVP